MDGFNVSGLNEILARLNELGDRAEIIEKKALKKGAEIVQEAMKGNVNRSDRDSVHIQDDLKVSIKDENGVKVAEIGPGKATAWRAKFLEFGTTKMPAYPFVEKSLTENREQVMEAIARELKRGMGLD